MKSHLESSLRAVKRLLSGELAIARWETLALAGLFLFRIYAPTWGDKPRCPLSSFSPPASPSGQAGDAPTEIMAGQILLVG
jgi:hypothetical protein